MGKMRAFTRMYSLDRILRPPNANRCENISATLLIEFMLSWQKSCVISVENQAIPISLILLLVYEHPVFRSGDVVAHRSLRHFGLL